MQNAKTLFKEIDLILREVDLEGFIENGAPENEYAIEADEIAKILQNLESHELTEEKIHSVVCDVWMKWLGHDEAEMEIVRPYVAEIARKILALKKAKEKQGLWPLETGKRIE